MKTGAVIIKTIYLIFLAALTAVADAFFQGGNTGLAGIAVKALVYFFLFAAFLP